MKAVFVDTAALLEAQQSGGESAPPIIVYDLEARTAERTTQVEISAATMRFDMAPSHNLARVWVEADADQLRYDGEATQWEVAR